MENGCSKIMLADTGRETTRLGFGSSGLMSTDQNRAASLRLLEAAYDAGIRHFDVAPMYGAGEAEACLGEFLCRHPDDTTVTTKFGLAPARNPTLLNLARRLGKPILHRLPGLRKRLVRGTEAVLPSGRPLPFNAQQARLSLESSLRALRVEHIDTWLLHEVCAEDLCDDDLLVFLEQAKASGKIGAFGAGSERRKIPGLLQERPAYCPVVQCEWSVLDAELPGYPAFTIHHRSLSEDFRTVHTAIQRERALCERWSSVTGRDLRDAGELGALMLKAALECNPGSIILFSSGNPKHIVRNVQVLHDDTLAGPARVLYALVQAEGVPGVRGTR